MADIGKSTTAHAEYESPSYPRAEAALENWGNYHASLPGSGTNTHPMFRDVKTGYREERSARSLVHDEDKAIETDQMVASFLGPFEQRLLFSKYIYRQSARSLAKEISAEGGRHGETAVNANHILGYISNAVSRIDLLIELSLVNGKK